ncbi:INSIG domain-containing protein [Ophiocordyceps sinensis CO18]|uniref:INSIG domain-containing protein n=1 Tax=Ophiocordyceps sinensis (strain Co18 / CGMCC 3.14243) TaxID=911162 RepID=T5AFN7_OPHSC|nr:INSIG domain-containing protein [Ophiocordyceps sinensis CO18]
MDDHGPPIARPIPRRPFRVNLMSVTPPYDDDQEAPEPTSGATHQDASPASRYLDASFTPTDAASLSRPQSLMNLTSSTLMGIFSEAASSRDRSIIDRDDDTPWGTGARTPVKRPGVDDATYELMRDRSHLPRRRSSYRPVDTTRPPSRAAIALSRVLRALLLFLLGVGYGVLVTRLHNEQQYLADLTEGIIKPGANWRYLTFWGVAGVVLGSLLPWVDRRWEKAFGSDAGDAVDDGDEAARAAQRPGTDWALVMRAIGAFVGIIFAIVSGSLDAKVPGRHPTEANHGRARLMPHLAQRKLAWASTLQVSAALALVNPLLWWLIDRSKPGFLLSACVGLMGSMLLLSVNPDMMPAPSRSPPMSATAAPNFSLSAGGHVLGGLASQETMETGVWMLSVLFCSCVCFGNIGRRLAWSRKAGTRGRWGGVR